MISIKAVADYKILVCFIMFFFFYNDKGMTFIRITHLKQDIVQWCLCIILSLYDYLNK